MGKKKLDRNHDMGFQGEPLLKLIMLLIRVKFTYKRPHRSITPPHQNSHANEIN